MNKCKRIMILGAGILQLPAILKAKEMGLQVIAVDMNESSVGFRYADTSLSISTIDIPKVVDAAKQYRVDGVMTLASDMPMRTVAAVAKELNIVGINEETALSATNKAVMRECLKSHNVPIPMFFKVNNEDEYITAIHQFKGKFIVKPADNSGSRGVFLVKDNTDAETIKYAYEYSKKNSRGGIIIVEEYMQGKEVSVETLSVNGEVHIIAVTDKLTTGAPRFVEMGHSQPSHFSEILKNRIKTVATNAVKAIGIENGPSHTEIIVTDEGPKVVELGARLGGDNITTHLVPLSTGIDMVKCCINIALGEKPDLKSTINKGAAIKYFDTLSGRINNITGVHEAELIPGVTQISFMKSIGDTVGEITSSTDRVGFVIAQAKDIEAAIQACDKAMKRITIHVEVQGE